ncbi:MAG TPA: hypothetical protein VKI65_17750 [Gemmataceae bacterium]|nr:hypothetical protein [Gemmataceae bacterium]
MRVSVRLEQALLDRCTALAKKKRISRDVLIARGLEAILAAEGEGWQSFPNCPLAP